MRGFATEKYNNAYAIFADKYKKEEDFETFKKNISSFDSIYLNYKPDSLKIINTTRSILPLDPATLVYEGEITYKDGKKGKIVTIFIWEKSKWKLYIVEFKALED